MNNFQSPVPVCLKLLPSNSQWACIYKNRWSRSSIDYMSNGFYKCSVFVYIFCNFVWNQGCLTGILILSEPPLFQNWKGLVEQKAWVIPAHCFQLSFTSVCLSNYYNCWVQKALCLRPNVTCFQKSLEFYTWIDLLNFSIRCQLSKTCWFQYRSSKTCNSQSLWFKISD